MTTLIGYSIIHDLEAVRQDLNRFSNAFLTKTVALRHDRSKQKYLSIAGKVLLYKMLQKLKLSPSDLLRKMVYNKNGKPIIENSKVNFNISHVESFVCCTVSTEAVGIDVEKESKAKMLKRVSPKVYSRIPFVINTIEDWIKLEARLKCLGTGLSGLFTVNPSRINKLYCKRIEVPYPYMIAFACKEDLDTEVIEYKESELFELKPIL